MLVKICSDPNFLEKILTRKIMVKKGGKKNRFKRSGTESFLHFLKLNKDQIFLKVKKAHQI